MKVYVVTLGCLLEDKCVRGVFLMREHAIRLVYRIIADERGLNPNLCWAYMGPDLRRAAPIIARWQEGDNFIAVYEWEVSHAAQNDLAFAVEVDTPSGPVLVRTLGGSVFYETREDAEYVTSREARIARVVTYRREP